MFTVNQIKEAHSKVKTGADFPRYVQDLIRLGVRKYSTFLNDGHTEFQGENNYHIQSEPRYAPQPVSDKSDPQKLEYYIKAHQQGQSDYPTICRQAARVGVEKWIVDIGEMTCTYYDKSGAKMMSEAIPQA